MEITVCRFCKTRVLPSSNGECPSCRKLIVAKDPGVGEGQKCPTCGASLAAGAVLCVACGYHLKLGLQLATAIDKESPKLADTNPYAPSELDEAAVQGEFLPDLTELGVRLAQAIVSDADSHLPLIVGGIFCAPLGLLLLPWYSFRLLQWYRLNREFAELRFPNSFSRHAELALRFQDAKVKLWRAALVGLTIWVSAILAFTLNVGAFLSGQSQD